ncbi:MAG TPA: hypothetical protein VGJ39_15615 [Vicinamibacterales bacterium]
MGTFRLVAGALLVGTNVWLAGAAFEPIAREGRAIEYVLVSPSFPRLGTSVALAAVALLIVQAWVVRRRRTNPREPFLSAGNTKHLSPLGWLALSLLPLANLFGPAAGLLPALSYGLFDLRWYWWPLVLLDVVRRIEPRVARPADWPSRIRSRLAFGTLVIIPIVSAIVFTPGLRFSGALHGDEPKYIRYCENFYQGLGFDVSKKRSLAELETSREPPHVLNNVRQLLRAVPEELVLLTADARRLVGASSAPRLVSQEPTPSMVFEGKHPGTVYQLHNPGLSFVLFPGYYLDRRLTGGGEGYRGEFPAQMPAVHITLLALYAGYALALYSLLRTYGGHPNHAWALALLGALTLPASAFPFQIYPEIAAGLIMFILVRALIGPPRSGPRKHVANLGLGLLAGFLPWLHVRFGFATAMIVLWMLTRRAVAPRSRLAFAIGVGAALGALSFYTYHLTGSLVPVATYGSDVPLTLPRVLKGVPAFLFDRVWGLFPHSPIYLLSLPGIGLAWRRRPDVGWILAVIAAVAVPAAGHGFWAGGSTPGRYLVAIAPLLLLFAADAMAAWSRRSTFAGAFAVLALASLQTAVVYNLYHSKEIGPLVSNEFSGWRFNLLFPSLGTDTWTATPADVALLVLWSAITVLLIWLPWRARRPVTSAVAADRPLQPTGLRPLFATLLAVVLVATVVAAGTRHAMAAEYLVPAKEARERALSAFVAVPRCALCYFSRMGAVEPTVALGNAVGFVDFRTEPTFPHAGQRVRIRVRPRTPDGQYLVSTVRLDAGDGSIAAYYRLFGDVDTVHVYPRPGDYPMYVWVKGTPDQAVEARLTLHVAP